MTIFVSHASEDKADFVRPLAHALKKFGVQIWYDEFSLNPGDSLRRSIDKGLAECTVGLVILSPNFFSKQWPQVELDALFSSAVRGNKIIVPVWLNITQHELAAVSPLLADRVAILADAGIESVASRVAALLPDQPRFSGAILAEKIERFQDTSVFSTEGQLKGCQFRFLQIQALHADYSEIRDSIFAAEDKTARAEIFDATDAELEAAVKRLFRKHDIPEGVYLIPDNPEPEENFAYWMDTLCRWTSGTMTISECRRFLVKLDEYLDIDYFYVLLGIPNFHVAGNQRNILNKAILGVGTWMLQKHEVIGQVCDALRELDANT